MRQVSMVSGWQGPYLQTRLVPRMRRSEGEDSDHHASTRHYSIFNVDCRSDCTIVVLVLVTVQYFNAPLCKIPKILTSGISNATPVSNFLDAVKFPLLNCQDAHRSTLKARTLRTMVPVELL